MLLLPEIYTERVDFNTMFYDSVCLKGPRDRVFTFRTATFRRKMCRISVAVRSHEVLLLRQLLSECAHF